MEIKNFYDKFWSHATRKMKNEKRKMKNPSYVTRTSDTTSDYSDFVHKTYFSK